MAVMVGKTNKRGERKIAHINNSKRGIKARQITDEINTVAS